MGQSHILTPRSHSSFPPLCPLLLLFLLQHFAALKCEGLLAISVPLTSASQQKAHRAYVYYARFSRLQWK